MIVFQAGEDHLADHCFNDLPEPDGKSPAWMVYDYTYRLPFGFGFAIAHYEDMKDLYFQNLDNDAKVRVSKWMTFEEIRDTLAFRKGYRKMVEQVAYLLARSLN